MPLLSSWDALVYAPAVALFLFVLFLSRRDRSTLVAAVAVPIVAFSVYLPPYYLDLEPAGIGGIGCGLPPTDPLAFLAVWGGFLALVYVAVAPPISGGFRWRSP